MDFAPLRTKLGGELVAAADAGYETRRREMAWNRLAPAARPAAVVRVADRGDVVESIRFARENGLQVAVRGGGHHWSGVSLREGSLLLDLSRLDAVEIDPVARTARVEPVVSNRELARRLEAHGLAFPLGHCPSVSVSGYLLGGGLGWNPGMWGPACASVEAVEVVTPKGDIVVADARNEPDLLWAARGAGPAFFAVVTAFHLELHPLPRAIRNCTLIYPLQRLGEIATWLEEVGPRLAPCVETVVCIAAAPPDIAGLTRGSNGMACLVIATAFAGTEGEAEEALAPLVGDQVPPRSLARTPAAATSFDGLFDGIARLFPEEHRYLADALWTSAPAAAAAPPLAAAYAAAPSIQSLALVVVGVPQAEIGALRLPGGRFLLCYAIWKNAQDDRANRDWHARLVAELEPMATGRYVGEADLAGGAGRIAGCYSAETWRRLLDLRQRYDPGRVFCSFPG